MAKALIEIGAKTADYQAAMKKAAQEMKNIRSEYSLAAAQAKLNGSAVDGLKAKQQELTALIAKQSDIVETNNVQVKNLSKSLEESRAKHDATGKAVKEAEEALEASKKATGENSEETEKLKKALDDVKGKYEREEKAIRNQEQALLKAEGSVKQSEAALTDLEVQLQDVNRELHDQKFDEYAEKAGKAADQIKDAGKKMMVVSTAIVGVGAASVKTGAEFDAEMSKVKAISGATEEEFKGLRDAALEWGGKTKFSASQSAEALEYMALAGWSAEDSIETLPNVLNLAAAADMDLGRASDIVTDYLTAFGLKTQDAGKFVDQLAFAMANSNTNVEMLGEAYKNCAATAGSMGFEVSDVTAVLMTMADAGVKGGEAGTTLNAIMTRLATDTKGCASELAKYGVEVYDAEGNMNSLSSILNGMQSVWAGLTDEEEANLAKVIAGQNQYSGLQTIMNGLGEDAQASGKSFNDYAAALENCNGSAQEMADTMQDNFSGQLTTLKSTLETIAIQISDILTPVLAKIVEHVQKWAEWFSNLDESSKKTVVTIAGIVAALGPFLLTVAKVINTTKKIATFIKTFKGIASLASPVGIVIGVFAALVGIGILVYKNWDTIKEKAIEIWGAIKDFFVKTWDAIKDTFSKAVEKVKTTTSNAWNSIKTTATNAWSGIKGKITGAWDNIKSAVSGAVDTVKSTVSGVWDKIKEKTGDIWNGIKETISGVWDGIKTTVSTVINTVKTTMSTVWDSIKKTASTVWEAIKKAITDPIGTAKNTISTVINTVKSTMSTAWDNIKSTASTLWENIKNAITGPIGTARDTVSNIVNGVKNTISGVWDSIKSTATSKWNAIKTAITTPVENAKKTVSDLIDKIKQKFNFSWSLPSLKLPHISITGKWGFNPPSYPKFSISWYREGGIMTQPTLFGLNGNKLLAGGEAGAEAILPLGPFYTTLTSTLTGILDKKFQEIEDRAIIRVTVVNEMDGEVISEYTADRAIDKVVRDYDRRKRR